jgi:hypothetical protein
MLSVAITRIIVIVVYDECRDKHHKYETKVCQGPTLSTICKEVQRKI